MDFCRCKWSVISLQHIPCVGAVIVDEVEVFSDEGLAGVRLELAVFLQALDICFGKARQTLMCCAAVFFFLCEMSARCGEPAFSGLTFVALLGGCCRGSGFTPDRALSCT